MFEKLWQFSSYLLQKGLKILEVGSVTKFLDGNIARIEENPDKLILRASTKGKPEYTDIYIKVKVDGDCVCTFSWSPDGRRFRQFGPEFKAREGEWIGAKIGCFATAEIQKNDGGSVEVY